MTLLDPPPNDAAAAADIANKLAGALRRAPMAVVELDADLRIAAWSEGAAKVFGRAADEAVGRSAAEVILRGEGDAEAFRAHLSGGGAARVFAGARGDGGAVHCEWAVAPLDGGGALCFGRDVTAEVEAEEERRVGAVVFRGILENVDLAVYAMKPDGTCIFHDGKAAEAAGFERGQLVGRNLLELYRDSAGHPSMLRALEGEPGRRLVEAHGRFWDISYVPVRGEAGGVDGMIGIALDVTQSKETERDLQTQLSLSERQQKVIRELSTPIIEVWNKVLTLPMVGVVDSARTAEVMDSLLEAVVRTGAQYAILDLTGVEAVDTKTAAYLIELVRAVRLLGAEGIITGIRPTVAQTVVALGLDLTSITTLSNLRAGLRHAILQMNKARSASAKARAPEPAR